MSVPAPRRGGPLRWVVGDGVRQAWSGRNWGILVLLALAALAVVLGAFVAVAVPWLIYPAL